MEEKINSTYFETQINVESNDINFQKYKKKVSFKSKISVIYVESFKKLNKSKFLKNKEFINCQCNIY
jgi:hypothetical protein